MGKNVYELAMHRIGLIFNEFDNIYISFSGGKDSGVMLNLCIKYIRESGLKRRIGIFHLDYEVQYDKTTQYVDRALKENPDIIDVYRVCVPFKVTTCTSMHQTFWRPWDDKHKELWVREQPQGSYTENDFPFFNRELWDYDFQMLFAEWYHQIKKAGRTCCLVGIRTQESFDRWRTIHSSRRTSLYKGLKWTHRIADNVYNAYVIHDWLTTDIWVANGRFGWDYNRLYDLYYQAGVPLEKQRVASPFISAAQENLSLYRALDPDMWGKMVCRINGVNFTALYGHTSALGRNAVALPEGYTWERYMHFLLHTLPEKTRKNYLQKLAVSIDFWRYKGGCLPEKTIDKLRSIGIKIEVSASSNYKTSNRPVRMEYQDDINIPEFRNLPTFKRMCVCILKNDHLCKYMGFALTKKELENKRRVIEFYKKLYT